MKTNIKMVTTALMMALMCAAAAGARPNNVKAEGKLAVHDVLTADISKDVTGRYVKRQASEEEVQNKVSAVKAQISDPVDGVRHIRFVAAIDSYLYDTAKFNIVAKNGNKVVKTFADKEVTTAYTHIEANGKVLSAAEAFNDASYNYMVAYTINNVPEEAWGYNFEVSVSIKTVEAEDFTTSEVGNKVINQVAFEDAVSEGVVDIVNDATYPWAISVVNGGARMESTTQDRHNTTTTVKITVNKDSILSFIWYVSSESSNYDYLTVYNETSEVYYVNKMGGTHSGNQGYTGKVAAQVAKGDVISFSYRKDGSSSSGEDKSVISDLFFTDGIVSPQVTKIFNDGLTENVTMPVTLLGRVGSDMLAAPENFRGENYAFEAWYYDAEFTRLVDEDDVYAKENVTLYAKWAEKVTISFVLPEGATVMDDISVWSGSTVEVDNPTLANHVFAGWFADEEFTKPVDLSVGMTENCTVYAKFDTMPLGLSRDVAQEIVFEEGSQLWTTEGATTIEERQDYYFKFVPTITETYTIEYSNFVLAGGNTSSRYYARMWIEDASGNVVVSDFDEDTTVELTAGVTYYLVFNGAKNNASYYAWGSFDLDVYYFEHDDEASAFNYTLGETISFAPGSFVKGNEKIVYKFEATETTNYKLHLQAQNSSRVVAYKDEIGGTTVANTYYVSGSEKNVDFPVVAGTTYYICLELNNWRDSDLASKTVSFSVTEYEAGYAMNNPEELELGETSTVDFAKGYTKYNSFVVSADDLYKFVIDGGSSSYTKSVAIYAADNTDTAIKTITCKTADEYIAYVELEAGEYFMVSKYTLTPSSLSVANYTVTIESTVEGENISKPVNITLPNQDEVVEGITGTGYYAFTVGENEVFHFFTANNPEATITIMTPDGIEVATSTEGVVYAKLDASTKYIVYVEGEDINVTYATVDNIVDGKSADTAYTYGVDSPNLPIPTTGDYTVWYKFTATESGTFKFYSLNNPASAEIDTKGYLFVESDLVNRVAYNDDGGSALMSSLGGYKFDFYFEFDVEAGQTYYIKVTYNVGTSDLTEADGAVLTLFVEKK